MSYHKIKDIPIPHGIVRDFFQPYAKTGNFIVDLFQEHIVIGLDILLHNRGAASLTISVDKGDALTVEAGDTFSWDNTKYSLIEVTSAVAYDMILGGVKLRALRVQKKTS